MHVFLVSSVFETACRAFCGEHFMRISTLQAFTLSEQAVTSENIQTAISN
jgi:hypothetical protein